MAYGLLIGVFLVALATNPTLGDGWFWELGNGIGFVAYAALLYLTAEARSLNGGTTKLHRWIGFFALAGVLSHALWFLIGDPIVIEYLKFTAPMYMVFGWFALALMLVLVFSSILVSRTKAYRDYKIFRQWHRYLALVVLISSAVHIAWSGFYFEDSIQWLLLAVITLGVILLPTRYLPKAGRFSSEKKQATWLMLTAVLTIALFALLRNISWA